MNTRNYQKELDMIIAENEKKGIKPHLLLHACCAPCSSYCLEYLSKYFDITVYYYNPNIYPENEFSKRAEEVRRLITEMKTEIPVKLEICSFNPDEFYSAVSGLEDCPEGGERCKKCFSLRLGKTAAYAKENGFDYFTTTLTISPLKNAAVLNKAGEEAADKYSVKHLPSDFKKKGGYQRSIVLSKDFGLYRQDYCGCVFSQRRDMNLKGMKKEEKS